MASLSHILLENRKKLQKEALQKAIRDYPGIPGDKGATDGQQLLYKDILLSDYLRMRFKDSSWSYRDLSSYGNTRSAEINAQRLYYPDSYKYCVVLKEDEYYNNGGCSNYIKVNTLSIVVVIVSRLIKDIHYHYSTPKYLHGKEFEKVELDEEYKESFFPRNVSTEEDITILSGKTIKDAVLRFGLNRKKGLYTEIGKIISIQLEDGSYYEFKGDKLPWHRFGDYSIDYGEHDSDGRSEFEGMQEQEDGTFEAKYSYIDYERDDPYADYSDDWKEMADEGAQFSWTE